MPNPINTGGIVGTDGAAPIYNPNSRFQVWNYSEIYFGTIGSGKYVPKIGDLILEIVALSITKYIVLDISSTTLIPVLGEVLSNNSNLTADDILLGIIPDTQSYTYRVYIDKSVVPFRLSVDSRLYAPGTLNRYCKIFKGSNISSTGLVISRMYDQSGILISENLPLELVATNLFNNVTLKVVAPGYTNYDLLDGELVTAVIYDDAGSAVQKRQLLVENTAFIRSTDANKKYIIGISLKSPFLSTTNSKLIQYPINVPLNGLNLIGVVTYSNGEEIEYPVDGTKFSIFGFEQYTATLVGQRIPLVLRYAVAPNEVAYNLLVGSETHISEQFEATTLNVDGSYNIKLFVYPVWIDSVSGYRLEYFMYNLDRNIKYNVTPYVTINTNVSLFNPTLYGTLQRLNVSLNIRDANGAYINYVHVQTVDIVLNKQGSERPNNWTIGYTPDQNPRYGVNTFATALFITTNQWRIKVNSGLTVLNDWLDLVYRKTLPIYDPTKELSPLEPNFFATIINGNRVEYPIASWNGDLIVNGNIINSSTIFIEFFKRTNTNDLRLAVAGVPVYHVNSSGNYL